MLTDYESLVSTASAPFIGRPEITSNVPAAVALAEAQINRAIIHRQQEQRATATVTEYVSLPPEYMQIRDIQLNTSSGKKTLEMMSLSQINDIDFSRGGSTGEPRAYCVTANQIQFAPAPDGTYTVEVVYVKKVPPLTGTAPTNWFLTDHPDCYLAGTQACLLTMVGDPRAGEYQTIFRAMLSDIDSQDKRQRWSGPPLATRPG